MKTILSTTLFIVSILTLGVGLFITHEILEFMEADRLLWFLFWVYVPAYIVIQLLQRAVDKIE